MTRGRVNWTGAVLFVVLAYMFSWGWLFAVPYLGVPLWTIGFSSFGPALAAAMIRGPLLGEGFRQSGLGFGTPPGRAWTYVFAAGVPPILVIVGAAILLLAGDAQLIPGRYHDPFQGQDFFYALATAHGPTGLLLMFVTSPLMSFEAFGEEYGWRGYLFPKLMPLGVLPAVIISGAVWALWHVPGYFIYGNNGLLTFVLFVATTTFGSTVLCWLRLRARSVWPAAIWHESFNNQGPSLAGLLTPTGLSALELTYALPAFVTIFELVMFAYLFIWGGILRAASEDRVVWAGLVRGARVSGDDPSIVRRPE